MKKNQIVMIHGTDYVNMTLTLLESIHLEEMIGDRHNRIALKPNLLLPSRPENGAVTHPELVEGVLLYLKKYGFYNIRVMEGAWYGASTAGAVKVSGVDAVCRKYNVPFIDLQKDSSYTCDAAGMEINVCSEVTKTDFLINLPVFKGHCQTLVTCALKNAKGLIPNSEKRRFHTIGLHKPIAHLNTVLPRGLVLVDNICGDLSFEEGGHPVVMNRIFACQDPVLCDAYVCESIGHSVDEVAYIRIAERLGIGSADTSKAELVLLNQLSDTLPDTRRLSTHRNFDKYIDAKDACSACYGSLIYALDRLQERGMISGKHEKICIGQGFKNHSGAIGVGKCTENCRKNLSACPPKALDIVNFLENSWE